MSAVLHAPVKAALVPTPAPKPALTPARGHVLQRKCACGTSPEGKCEKCNDEGKTLQRHAADHQSAPSSIPPVVHDVLGSPGRPLDPATRSFMEPRFGTDFSRVRVHTDGQAAESARAVNARAYTVGQNIAFAQGQYAPDTPGGRHLLAHELAHTVQQQGLQRFGDGSKLVDSPAYSTLEREADAAAFAVMQGGKVLAAHPTSDLQIQRAPWSLLLEGGKCPEGTPLDATKPAVYDAAELEAVEMYKDAKPENIVVFSNRAVPGNDRQGKLEELNVEDEMLQALQGEFHRGPGIIPHPEEEVEIPVAPSATTESEAEDTVATPPVTKKAKAPRKAKGAKQKKRKKPELDPRRIRKLMYRRPDILDVSARRVFDVTTSKQAAKKKGKITSYVEDLNTIRKLMENPGDPWQAGSDTDFPPVSAGQLVVRFRGRKSPDVICFGPTDLSTYHGVIAYDAIKLGGETIEALGEPYEVLLGGQMVSTYSYPAPSVTDLLNSGPHNKAVAESIPGVILKTLRRKAKGPDTIEAEIETSTNSKSEHKSKVPFTIAEKVPVVYSVNQKTRKLTLRSKKANIPVGYEKLSTGAITKLEHSDEKGLSGEGTITPSIPLLKGVHLGFAFAEDYLAVTVPLKKPNVPIPGFKVTDFKLALELLPEFKPSGTIAFTIGTGKRALMDGVITISADAEGLLATGDVTAHIPGVDEAKGNVTYRPSQGWTGVITITTSKIPYVQSANVTVTLTDKGLDLDGGLEIALPGDQHVALKVEKRRATSWVYTGRGEFKVPRLKPVVITFVYDGEDVTGTAKTGFKFKEIDGDIELVYTNGVVTGTAHLEFSKSNGRLKGSLDVTLNKNRKFSGGGKITYEIKPGLIATAGIIIDQEEKVTVVGLVTFPPYKLFEQYPKPAKRVKIFSFSKDIPVPYLSIGPVGLEARIGAGLFMEYGIGPGMIVGGYIKGQVNPLEDNPDPEIELGGRISVPMFFSITGYISGGLVLDVGIAEAGGKIVVSVTADLEGEGGLSLVAKYSKGEFRAEVDVKLLVELFLRLCVSAYVWAEAGVWRFKVRTSKSWNLLDFPYKTGLQLGIAGLKKPIAYSSKSGFELPSFDDINWVKPSLDAAGALERGVDAAGGQDDGPRPRPCPVIDEE